jgi:ferritin
MNERLRDALNDQVGYELHAAYLYLAMMNHFEEDGLDGFAHWMRMQAGEEVAHAMKIMDHLHDRDATVELGSLPAPEADFGSALEVMEAALAHERKVTGLIHDLYDLAREEGDHPAQVMLEWFIEEQVEEEKSARDIVEMLELAGGDGPAMLMLDARMAERGGGEEG